MLTHTNQQEYFPKLAANDGFIADSGLANVCRYMAHACGLTERRSREAI